MSIRKRNFSKEDLVRNEVYIKWRDGQPVVCQKYQKEVRDKSKYWHEERPIKLVKGKHKYVEGCIYPTVNLKIDGKYETMVVSNVV